MSFHSGFQKNLFDFDLAPGWFEARAKLYGDVAKWVEREPDEVYFDFSTPNAGWMDVGVYSNGKLLHTFTISAACDPFSNIREWMESIVNDNKLAEDLYIEVEGRTIIMHYEHIRLAEKGVSRIFVNEDRELDRWQPFDVMSYPDIGLFYLYDSGCKGIPVVCLCKTKHFLATLYEGLLNYSSLSKHSHLIGKEWYYMDRDDDGEPTMNNFDFYNTIKSPLIEWNIYSDCAYRHLRPTFKPTPKIEEVVHMWPDYGEAIFWDQEGVGSGDTTFLEIGFGDNIRTIDITPISAELQEWYDEWDNIPIAEGWGTDEEFRIWLHKGWELAKKVRQLLPESVDLFYDERPYKAPHNTIGFVTIPHIVPDERRILKHEDRKYRLPLFR